MSLHVKHNPDGTLEVQGEAYRITDEPEGACTVHRVSDGARVGTFFLEPAGKDRYRARIEAADASEAVLRAVADAWAEPRSPLPLQ